MFLCCTSSNIRHEGKSTEVHPALSVHRLNGILVRCNVFIFSIYSYTIVGLCIFTCTFVENKVENQICDQACILATTPIQIPLNVFVQTVFYGAPENMVIVYELFNIFGPFCDLYYPNYCKS